MLSDLKHGLLRKRLNAISQKMKLALLIIVYATGVNERDPDAPKRNISQNSIQFSIGNNGFTLIKDSARGILNGHTDIDSFERLTEIFDSKDLDWFWLDLHLAFEVPFADQDRLKEFAEAFLEQCKDYF